MNQKHKTLPLILMLIGLAIFTFSCTPTQEEPSFPEEVIKQLEDLYDEDQMMRNTESYLSKWAVELFREYGLDSREYQFVQARHDSLAKERELLDKQNAEILVEILDLYGWPHRSQTSRWANLSAFFVVQHNFDIQEKYLPLLIESAKMGESSAWNVAWLQDRVLLVKGLPQRYGSQLLTINGVTYIWPLEDSTRVDELRKEMGIKPLAEFFNGSIPPIIPDTTKVSFQFY